MSFFPRLGGSGIGLSQLNQTTNLVTLQPCEIFLLPAGAFAVAAGSYSSLQWLDPVSGRWITINAVNTLVPHMVDSDGTNFRLANLTGCSVGASVTAAGNGTGLTNGIGAAATGLTVTVSSGGSTWVPVVGGSVNPTVVVTAGNVGSGYIYPPILEFSPPPSGGVQASGYCLIGSGTISSVVVVNQGAGYTVAPSVTVINDSRDTVGTGGAVTLPTTLIGNTQLTALYPSNPGTSAVTSVPTFTFSPTSAITATMIMNFTVTGISGVGAQTTFTGSPLLIGMAAPVTASSTRITAGIAGPIMDTNLTQPRPALLSVTTATNALTTTAVIIDGGFGFQQVPTAYVLPAGLSVNGTAGIATLSVGGTNDTSYVQPV